MRPRRLIAALVVIVALPAAGPATAGADPGDLWTYGTAGTADTQQPLMAGTNPSIAPLTTGGYEIAAQASNGAVLTAGNDGAGALPLGMAAGTSPAIAPLPNGSWQLAFQANTTQLWTAGGAGVRNWRLGMMAHTSPTITGLASGGYGVAFQAKPPPPAPVVSTPVASPVPLPAPAPVHSRRRALRIEVKLSWTWNRAHTRLTRLALGRHPRGTVIRLRCRGRGCPSAHARTARAATLRRLEHSLRGSGYRAGDRIFLTLTAARYSAERVEIWIRSGTLPAVRLL